MLRFSSVPLPQLQADALVVEVHCIGGVPKDAFRKACDAFPDLLTAYRRSFDAGEMEPGKLLVVAPSESRKTTIYLAPTRVHPKGELRADPIRQVAKAVLEDSLRRGLHSVALLPFESERGLDAKEVRQELLCSFARSPDLDLIWLCDEEQEVQSPRVSIFTDGSAEPSGGKGGYGAILRIGDHSKEISCGYQSTSSNRMELMAAVAGLEALNRPCQVRLHSDSRFVVDTVNNGLLFRRAAAGWKKKKIPAVDLWKRFFDQYLKHDVEVVWVKAHAGIEDNHRCDRLAAEAMLSEPLLDDEGYRPENRPKRKKKKLPKSDSLEAGEATGTSSPDWNLAGEGDESKELPLTESVTRLDRLTESAVAGEDGESRCGGCGHRLEKRVATRRRSDSSTLSTWYLFCTNCKNFYHLGLPGAEQWAEQCDEQWDTDQTTIGVPESGEATTEAETTGDSDLTGDSETIEDSGMEKDGGREVAATVRNSPDEQPERLAHPGTSQLPGLGSAAAAYRDESHG